MSNPNPTFAIPGLGFATRNETLPDLPDERTTAPTGETTNVLQSQEVDMQNTGFHSSATGKAAPVELQATQNEGQDSLALDASHLQQPDEKTAESLPVDTDMNSDETAEQEAPVTTEPHENTEAVPGSLSIGGESEEAEAPSITLALEEALGILPSQATETQGDTHISDAEVQIREIFHQQPQPNGENHEQQDSGLPEVEPDSSPYQSSDSDSSDDSSPDDSDSEDEADLPGLLEAARAMMANAVDSDDDEEDGGKGKGTGATGHPRTKNERPDMVPPKPDITISPDMKITLLGKVKHIVENTLVVEAKTAAEYQVLDAESILCKEDRTVIGVVADLFGNTLRPVYSVRFNSEEEIKEVGLEVGSDIYYPENFAKTVFTQSLKAFKGSDASNFHDEEVCADEMEFSDDEKEQEFRRQQKAKRRGGKNRSLEGRAGSKTTKSHPLRNEVPAETPDLKYDEDDDGPYRPLARPVNFGQGLSPIPPEPTNVHPPRGGGGSFRGHDGRGRGNHSRGRGGRGRGGRGCGGHQDGRHEGQRDGHRERYSCPPQHPYQGSQPVPPPQAPPLGPWDLPPLSSAPIYGRPVNAPPVSQPAAPAIHNVWEQYSHQWTQDRPQQQYHNMHPHQSLPPVQYQAHPQQPAHVYAANPAPQYGQPQTTPAWPVPPPPASTAGTYVNPAFFAGRGQQPAWNPPQQSFNLPAPNQSYTPPQPPTPPAPYPHYPPPR